MELIKSSETQVHATMTNQRCTRITSLLFLIILFNPVTSRYTISVKDKAPWEIDFSASRKEQPSRCTKRDLPCYPVSLDFIRDGICSNPTADPEFIKGHFAKVGIIGTKAIAAKGRESAQLIYEATGFDFTGLPDDAYLYATATTRDGSVTFRPRHFTDLCKYRLTGIQIKDQIQFINKIVSNAGWGLVINKETKVGGTINKVLPEGSVFLVGSYVILPCERNKDKNCQSIHNPEDPYEPIFIEWVDRLYGPPALQPGPFFCH